MKKILAGIVTFFILSNGFSQDLQTILNKNHQALGLDARKGIQYLRTDGYVRMTGTEANIPFRILQAKPDMVRVETTVFGFKAIQTYDGEISWTLSPTQGMEAIKTDPRDMEFIAAATAIDGPFSLNKNNKYTLKYLGEDKYQEKPVHVVTWSADLERLKYYVNSTTWLIDGVRYEYKKNGAWYSMECRINSYRMFSGAKFPDKVSALVNGVEMLSLQVTDMKIPEVPDKNRFGKPAYN